MNESVKQWLVNWFKENSPAFPELYNEALGQQSYFEAGWIDSLQFISFISELEEKFSIHFSNDDFQNRDFSTLDGLARIIEHYQSHNG